jgi:hypothetical protein
MAPELLLHRPKRTEPARVPWWGSQEIGTVPNIHNNGDKDMKTMGKVFLALLVTTGPSLASANKMILYYASNCKVLSVSHPTVIPQITVGQKASKVDFVRDNNVNMAPGMEIRFVDEKDAYGYPKVSTAVRILSKRAGTSTEPMTQNEMRDFVNFVNPPFGTDLHSKNGVTFLPAGEINDFQPFKYGGTWSLKLKNSGGATTDIGLTCSDYAM